jgi:hypothetical protein
LQSLYDSPALEGSLVAEMHRLPTVLTENVPAEIENAAAVAILGGDRVVILDVLGEPVVYRWNSSEIRFSDAGTQPVVTAGFGNGPEDQTEREREIYRVARLLMRCLPEFEAHPALRLIPRRKYQVPSKLLPSFYVDRFRDDMTQLDGTVLFKYHQQQLGWFQLPHSNPAFQVPWSNLWTELRAGRILLAQ